MNTVILLGRLTKTPEIKVVNTDTKLLSFTLAVSKKYQGEEKTSYINCISFNKLAEIIGQYADKGARVLVEGELQTRSYDKDGQKVYVTEVLVSKATILDYKERKDEPAPQPSKRSELLNFGARDIKDAENKDDDLPF